MLKEYKIPPRRDGITVPINYDGKTYHVTFTWHPEDEHLCEVFYSQTDEDPKTGADMNVMLKDACILMSLLVQRGGLCFEEIAERLGENRAPGKDRGPPSSILGAIAVAGAMIE